MFIEVETDVFEEIEFVDDASNKNIVIITRLFQSMIDGKHIVFTSRKNIISLLKNKAISQEITNYLSWVLSKYSNIYACRNTIKSKISTSLSYDRVEYSVNTETGLETINVPYKNFSSVYESKLLTENEEDFYFYLLISKFIYHKNTKTDYYEFCFENDSYHGGNGSSRVEYVASKNNQVLCIVDSDRPYSGGKRGSTFENLNKAVKKAKKAIAIHLYELPVREKENLIPASIYKEFTENEMIKVIADTYSNDNEISDYFDIKEGVKVKKIESSDSKWHEKYDDLIDCFKERGICNLDMEDKDKSCVEGIGGKISNKVIEVLFQDTSDKRVKELFADFPKEKRIYILDNKDSIIERLPERVEMYWKEISEHLFDWGCCLSTDKYPRMRNWDI